MNDLKWINIALTIIISILVIYILKELKAIFIPLIFALFLTFLFAPINRFLQRKKVPMSIIIIILVTIIFVSFSITGSLVYAGIAGFAKDYPKYEAKMSIFLSDFIDEFQAPTKEITLFLKKNVEPSDIISKISFTEIISGTMGTFADFLIKLTLTIFFMIFIVAGKSRFVDQLAEIVTQKHANHKVNLIHKIENGIKKYIISKTLISLSTSLIGMGFMALYQIDFVVIGGMLLFVFNFIPNVGSIVASIFPIIVSLLEFGLGWQTFAIAISLLFVQVTFGNLIEPKVMGMGLKLSPIIILISLIFWGWVWGPVGMVLAVPITSTINIVLKEFKCTENIVALMSDEK